MRMITVHCVGFSCSRMSGRVALLVVAVAAILFSVQSQRVVTRTMTVTETSTEVRMSTTRMLCAKMVNATGFCRRRRGKWLVEPLVLTFDEDMDVVDRLLDPTLPVMLETTLVPVIPVIPADYPAARNDFHVSVVPIAPSMSLVPEARPGLSILSQIMQIISQSLASRTRSTTTVTTTMSMTSTVTSMLTSMRTFFVQNCTPSPFPFSLCSR